MNTCILMAEVIQDPQLRYTQDNQLAIAEFMVQFEGLRDDDPMTTLKVVGFGNLAQEIQDNYRQGDRLILEGRLGMITLDRPEGFKEKRAELTVQRIHKLGSDTITSVATSVPTTTAPAPVPAAPASRPVSRAKAAPAEPTRTPAYPAPPVEPPDYDDIPF